MKLREKLISIALAVALIAAFVPCSGCVEGGVTPDTVLINIDGIKEFFGIENFNSPEPIVGVWKNTRDANPTRDYEEFRFYSNGSFKYTEFVKKSYGFETHGARGFWRYSGTSGGTTKYYIKSDDNYWFNQDIYLSANNNTFVDKNHKTYWDVGQTRGVYFDYSVPTMTYYRVNA